MLITYGRFVEQGTLANQILGENASNRDTSDAPLWFGVACEELAAARGDATYAAVVDKQGRTLADVLEEIGAGYRDGTPNGIRMDPVTALIDRGFLDDVVFSGPPEPDRPQLSIRISSPGRVEITWPATAAGFTLETVESLDPQSSWSSVATGGQTRYEMGTTGLTQFFRLRSP